MGQVLGNLVRGWRTNADQAHLSFEHVQELGQLIEVFVSEHTPNGRYPGITLHFKDIALHLVVGKQLLQPLFGIQVHGAKFVEGKESPILSYPRLAKQDRPRGLAADLGPIPQIGQATENKPHGCPHNVQQAFDE